MLEVRLPAYPIITFDPLMSIWSTTDKLYDSATTMWTGVDKPINGNIIIDGVPKRFMGISGADDIIFQDKIEMSMTQTKYTFSDNVVELTVKFTQPLFLDDLALASCPIAYIDVQCISLDKKEHQVTVIFDFSEKITYDEGKKGTRSGMIPLPEKIAYLGRALQKPLTTAGDRKEIDWGWLYISGESKILTSSVAKMKKYFKKFEFSESRNTRKILVSEHSGVIDENKGLNYYNIFAYDDVSSINYFGQHKKGFWTTKYYNILNAIQEATKNHDANLLKAQDFDNKVESETIAKYGRDYLVLLIAAYRQTLAAHKLVQDENGMLCFSKECGSNGCLGTVDVSYPAAPLFLIYAPEIIKALLVPVFDFARMKSWPYEFAPHDVGCYPFATGQVYGIKGIVHNIKSSYFATVRRHVYRMSGRKKLYSLHSQMPIEECGNMLILTAAYFLETSDIAFVKHNTDILQKWANYLVSKGIYLSNQLCTDDFAGRSANNVNLAIKSIMGIAAWGLVLNKLQSREGEYYIVRASELSKELMKVTDLGDHMAMTIDNRDSWSLKYNLIWDKIFETNLFNADFLNREIEFYKTKILPYGIQLDSRSACAKTDWEIWVAALGDIDFIKDISASIVKMLAESKDRVPFTDRYDVVNANYQEFCHRSVQGGLWMVAYKDIISNRTIEKQKENLEKKKNASISSVLKTPSLEEQDAILREAQEILSALQNPELKERENDEIEMLKMRGKLTARLETLICYFNEVKRSNLDAIKEVLPADIYDKVTTLDAKEGKELITSLFDTWAFSDFKGNSRVTLQLIKDIFEYIIHYENLYSELIIEE
ncbi:MAG: DUF4965 domain-containing protein [Christensenellaceae bacterium]|jgi:hypothetical protein|nr:DUF4965 domain-containing protein [Christensenellaceae bacterium]